jgi:taurine dioxygenase
VLFIRNQHITGNRYLAFAACFGELDEPHPVFDRGDSDPHLTIIESKGRVHEGEHYWHADVTYQEASSFGSAKSKA